MNSNNKEKTKAISKVNTRLSRHYRNHEISTNQLLKNASNQLLKNASCNILWGEGKWGKWASVIVRAGIVHLLFSTGVGKGQRSSGEKCQLN